MTVGQNVFGIARAPRIASTESMVIAAPWTRDNLHGVSLALALGAMMKSKFRAEQTKSSPPIRPLAVAQV